MPDTIDRTWLARRALHHLEQLVAIPSPSGDEAEISHHLARVLAGLGLDVTLQPVGSRFNVVARTAATGAVTDILLTGHTDTVPVLEGWETDPFRPTIAGDRLYGLGAADQKAGIAAQLAALDGLYEAGLLHTRNLLVAFTPDEEALSDGMLAFLEDRPQANLALLSEPHYSPVTIGWPGKALVKVTVHGKAAHGGRPQHGVNAIEQAALFLAALAEAQVPEHPRLGRHPFVTLSIRGGYERYSLTVPDRCELTISKQLVPGESKDSVLELVHRCARAMGAARLEAELARPYYPPAEVDPGHPQLQRFAALHRRVTGEDPAFGYGKGVNDGDYLVEAGITTVIFGPSGGNTHQPNEWVSLEQTAVCAEVYYRMCVEG
ncbi:MAG: M20/M25/M40 family metallo-hydrolase [Bacillota bacterium]|nr:M20/M25/M40 family metallo-hydrolase [Bacillota bacterium]